MQVRFLPSLLRALWVQALSIGVCQILLFYLVHCGTVEWRWRWFCLVCVLVGLLCRPLVVGSLLLLVALDLCAPYRGDFELVFLGHQTALWVACLGGMAVVAQAVLRPPRSPGVHWLAAGLAGMSAAGLAWAVHSFEGAQWWSVVDLAEGASFVLVLALVGALHARSAGVQRAVYVLGLLAAAAVCWVGDMGVVFAVVHRGSSWGPGHAGFVLVLGAWATHFARAPAVGGYSLCGAGPLLDVSPRVACLGALVLWPYMTAVMGVGGWSSLLSLAGLVLAWGRPLRGLVGVSVAWAVGLGCGPGLGGAVLPCCAQWAAAWWWAHVACVLLYYCLLAPVGPSWGGCSMVAAELVSLLLAGLLAVRLGVWVVRNSGVRWLWAVTLLSP